MMALSSALEMAEIEEERKLEMGEQARSLVITPVPSSRWASRLRCYVA